MTPKNIKEDVSLWRNTMIYKRKQEILGDTNKKVLSEVITRVQQMH